MSGHYKLNVLYLARTWGNGWGAPGDHTVGGPQTILGLLLEYSSFTVNAMISEMAALYRRVAALRGRSGS